MFVMLLHGLAIIPLMVYNGNNHSPFNLDPLSIEPNFYNPHLYTIILHFPDYLYSIYVPYLQSDVCVLLMVTNIYKYGLF